jgi:hypothetical protein
MNAFFNSINKEVFDKTQGITVTVMEEVVFIPTHTGKEMEDRVAFRY